MSDIFELYKKGVDRLLADMEEDHPDYNTVLDQRHRLIENIDSKVQLGENSTLQPNCNEILHNLNNLSLHKLGKPFYMSYEELNQKQSSKNNLLRYSKASISQNRSTYHRINLKIWKFGYQFPLHKILVLNIGSSLQGLS